jgi:fimbrial chaperone protein
MHFSAGVCDAASLDLSPTTVQFSQGKSNKSVQITNRSGEPVTVQARAFLWQQEGDVDNLSPSSDVAISPPIFTLPPGATQTLRVLLRNTKADETQRSYRLLIDDITPAPTGRAGPSMAIRISLPVIVEAEQSRTADLRWRAETGSAGTTVFTVTNLGHSHDNVRQIGVTLANGSIERASPMAANTYILPGATRRWTVPNLSVAARETLMLSLATATGTSELAVVRNETIDLAGLSAD